MSLVATFSQWSSSKKNHTLKSAPMASDGPEAVGKARAAREEILAASNFFRAFGVARRRCLAAHAALSSLAAAWLGLNVEGKGQFILGIVWITGSDANSAGRGDKTQVEVMTSFSEAGCFFMVVVGRVGFFC